MLARRDFASILVVASSTIAPSAAAAQTYKDLYSECYQGDLPDKVIAACTVLIEKRVGDANDRALALSNRGNAYDDKGEYELAINDYNESLAVNPGNSDALNNRGTTRTALREYEAAIQDFDRALELRPSSMALSNRCFAKAAAGHLESALPDCNQAIRLHPNRFATFGSRGLVYLKMGRPDKAISDYNKVLAKRPDDPYALYGRAIAERAKGSLRASDDDTVHALSVKPDIAEHMAKIGVSLGRVTDHKE